jgi:hypothetical protein
MHLTAPSHWSRSIGTGGRDASERVVTIVVMRTPRRARSERAAQRQLQAWPVHGRGRRLSEVVEAAHARGKGPDSEAANSPLAGLAYPTSAHNKSRVRPVAPPATLSLPRLSSEQMPHMHGTHKEMPSVRGLHSGKKARIFNLVGVTSRQAPLFRRFLTVARSQRQSNADGRARRR